MATIRARGWLLGLMGLAAVAGLTMLLLALLTRPSPPGEPVAGSRPMAGESAWPGLPLALRREPTGLRLRALGPLPAPDLLLYAAAAPVAKGQPLPPGVVFLGSVVDSDQVLHAPPASSQQLVLYSLAHGEVVGSAPVPEDRR